MAQSTKPVVRMRPLKLDYKTLSVAAQTLSLSFASDPLICWLKKNPAGPGWEALHPIVQTWQEARIRGYAVSGIGMEAITEGEGTHSVGLCHLFPPKPPVRWINPLWWPAYFRVLWDMYWVKPPEPFGNEERIDIMMEAHDEAGKLIKRQYPPNSLYYLEIVAVRPDAQGLGVGGAIMNWVVERLGDSPCYLECTNVQNVPFYEKYGFKLVEERKLCDKGDPNQATVFYYMVRDKGAGASSCK